jgi:hypothetical protein
MDDELPKLKDVRAAWRRSLDGIADASPSTIQRAIASIRSLEERRSNHITFRDLAVGAALCAVLTIITILPNQDLGNPELEAYLSEDVVDEVLNG